jgi:hypothetical protein
MTEVMGTTSLAAALRAILAAKVPRPTWEEFVEFGLPLYGVPDNLGPGNPSLRAVCIRLAYLAADRYTEEELTVELVRELDKVQQIRAELEFERENPELYDDDNEQEG